MMNNCSNYVDLYPDPSSHLTSRIIFFSLYSLIFVFGLIGNIAVIYITLLNTTLQSVQNLFILNLAVADIIVCLLSVPITPITLIYKTWYFGTVLCHIIPWVQGSSIFITSYILTAIAFNRYLLITRPHANAINKSRARWITVFVWVCSACVTIPYACYMKVKKFDGLCGQFCDEDWPMNALHMSNMRRTFTIGCLVVQFLIPLLFILSCYGLIFHNLRERTKAKLIQYSTITTQAQDNTNQDISQAEKVLRQNQRTNKILTCMVLSFGISWLPYSFITVLNEYYSSYLDHNRYLIYLFTHSIAMFNTVLNPILYAWLNSAFKTAILDTVSRTRRRRMSHRELKKSCGTRAALVNTLGVDTAKSYRSIQTDPLLITKIPEEDEILEE